MGPLVAYSGVRTGLSLPPIQASSNGGAMPPGYGPPPGMYGPGGYPPGMQQQQQQRRSDGGNGYSAGGSNGYGRPAAGADGYAGYGGPWRTPLQPVPSRGQGDTFAHGKMGLPATRGAGACVSVFE